jgi:hypothetical protein
MVPSHRRPVALSGQYCHIERYCDSSIVSIFNILADVAHYRVHRLFFIGALVYEDNSGIKMIRSHVIILALNDEAYEDINGVKLILS